LSSWAAIHAWIALASHSIDHRGGFPRAVFGFTRSWFEMGKDSIEFRRFLLHDPYVHTSPVTLLFKSLGKLVLTYMFFAAISLKLLRGSVRDHRVVEFLALTFLPVLAFGVKWQGGDMERYIAAFPAILLAGACALTSRPLLLLKVLGIVFLSTLVIVNLPTDLGWVRDQKDRALAARLDALGPIPVDSYVVVFPADPLVAFLDSRSVSSAGRGKALIADSFVATGRSYATDWREIFALRSLQAWQSGQEVWICRGLLDATPESHWGWVEGAEPDVRWTDIHAFFSELQISDVRGDFVQVPPTEPNLQLLQAIPPPVNYP
jgi:hypothetical protein